MEKCEKINLTGSIQKGRDKEETAHAPSSSKDDELDNALDRLEKGRLPVDCHPSAAKILADLGPTL